MREDVHFASGRDRCAAWLFRPTGTDAPVPCVVMASGLSCVRDQGLDTEGECFAAAGFAVLAFAPTRAGHFDPFLGETFERMAADQVDFLSRQLRQGSGRQPANAG